MLKVTHLNRRLLHYSYFATQSLEVPVPNSGAPFVRLPRHAARAPPPAFHRTAPFGHIWSKLSCELSKNK